MAKLQGEPRRGWRQRTVQQWGEYLVAAELAKRGYLATTFTGNVPHFDLVVTNEDGQTVPVQVKGKREKGNWQFNLDKFATTTSNPDGTLRLRKCRMPASNTLWVLVHLHEDREADFYWFSQEEFQSFVLRRHRAYLRRHGGRRPKKEGSTHSSIAPRDIPQWKNRWRLIDDALRHGENPT